MTNETWRERLAEWQGEMNVTVRELSKNQDELEEKIDTLQIDSAVLKTLAKQAGKRWGLICGVIASVAAAIIIKLVTIYG